MLRRTLLASALVATSFAVINAGPGADAASGQRTLWNESGSQTRNSYYQPINKYVAGPDAAQPNSYTNPNYAGGAFYLRIQVTNKPSNIPVVGRLCFWRTFNGQKFQEETCGGGNDIKFTSTGTMWIKLSNPAGWWDKTRPDGKATFDWGKQYDVGRIMLFDGRPANTGPFKGKKAPYLLLDQACGKACYVPAVDALSKHVPIGLNSRIEMVPKGQAFAAPSEWRNSCPSTWGGGCTGPASGGSGGGSTSGTTTGGSTSGTTSGGSSSTSGSSSTGATTTIAPTTTVNNGGSTTGGSTTGGTTGASGECASPYTGSSNTQPNPTATSGNGSISVSWPSMSNARLFQVRTISDNTGNVSWKKPAQTTSATLSGLNSNDCYTVQVRAYANGAWRGWSSLKAAADGSGGGTTTGTTGGSTTGGETTTTVGGTTGGGSGACSVAYTGSSNTQPKPVATPGASSITVTWPAVSGAKQYQVRILESSSGTRQWVKVSARSYTFNGASGDYCYDIAVRALVNGKWRGWSTLQASAV